MNKYKSFKAKNITFLFATEENPATKEFDYHIWIRQLVMPREAIKAFFSANEHIYNSRYDRYEAFSGVYNMSVYYFYPDKTNENLIIVISAFTE